jgi:hypothetical protein
MSTLSLPNSKRFAFTIFDDTDNSTVQNVKPVYDLLTDLGFQTTKSVWVYPPRGRFTGSCLQDPGYLSWILKLQADGFEIGLHNVGDGAFTRREIHEGLEIYRSLLGHYPLATPTMPVSAAPLGAPYIEQELAVGNSAHLA